MRRINQPSILICGLTAVFIMAACLSSFGAKSKEEKEAEKQAKRQAALEARQAKLKAAGLYSITNPPKVKLGEFKQAELKATTIAEKHANHKGNQESARIMDNLLNAQLKTQFTELKSVAATAEFSKPTERTLQIAPHIVEIRLISVGSRIWVGPMAGGSHLLVKVTLKDNATGEVIAEPQFYVDANAWAGAGTVGAMDNQIRDRAVQDIAAYLSQNR